MFKAHHQRTNWSPIDEPGIPYSPAAPGKAGAGRVYTEALAKCKKEIVPVEVTGGAGTVRFIGLSAVFLSAFLRCISHVPTE
eukprot:SAG22_NODE_1265_length_4958_cov_61.157440_2_plen_82_part_00